MWWHKKVTWRKDQPLNKGTGRSLMHPCSLVLSGGSQVPDSITCVTLRRYTLVRESEQACIEQGDKSGTTRRIRWCRVLMEVAQAAAHCLEVKVWMEVRVKHDQPEVSLVEMPCGGAVEFWETLQEEEEVRALWIKTPQVKKHSSL